jgi:hypothetical protein
MPICIQLISISAQNRVAKVKQLMGLFIESGGRARVFQKGDLKTSKETDDPL